MKLIFINNSILTLIFTHLYHDRFPYKKLGCSFPQARNSHYKMIEREEERDKENKRKTEGEEEKKRKSERKEEVSELVSFGCFYNKVF